MGFLDKAKKLAEQAKGMAEDALAERRASQAEHGAAGTAGATDSGVFGTAYVPGMLGRPGWRERGLVDPAALLPIEERDRAGIPRSTKSEIVEEPYGMGRRWSSSDRSAGVFYQLHPDHQTWQPTAGGDLGDGRTVHVIGGGEAPVVLELRGFDESFVGGLTAVVRSQLQS